MVAGRAPRSATVRSRPAYGRPIIPGGLSAVARFGPRARARLSWRSHGMRGSAASLKRALWT